MTWEEVTAVSTLALAAVTWRLARSTRSLAHEANAETRANWRPVLVPDVEDDPVEDAPSGLSLEDRVLSLRVRNIGRGPALNVTVALWDESQPEPLEKVFHGRAAANVVAPDERLVFEWRDFGAPAVAQGVGLAVWSQLDGRITYGDVGYVRYETEIKVGFRLGGVVRLIDHQFLGAARDRLSRSERLWYRAAYGAFALERHSPRLFRPLARKLARITLRPPD